jgi:hypothetical protein
MAGFYTIRDDVKLIAVNAKIARANKPISDL